MRDLSEAYRMRNGVTFADGFLAGGLACGIKKDGKSDLAIIASTTPASAWALLTTNRVKGAPVLVTRANLRSKITRAIVVTSGNANTVTLDGIEHARSMTEAVGRALECRASQVLTAATGVIRQPLPIDKVLRGIPELAPRLTADGGSEVSEAILTTDSAVLEIFEKAPTVHPGLPRLRIRRRYGATHRVERAKSNFCKLSVDLRGSPIRILASSIAELGH